MTDLLEHAEETSSADAWEAMRQFIDARVPDGEFTAAELADKIRADAAELEPMLLAAFEEDLSRRQIAMFVADHLRHARNRAQRAIQRSQTDEKITEDVRSGRVRFFDQDAPAVFGSEHKKIGSLTRDDCAAVRDYFQDRSRYAGLQAAFWEQARKRVKAGRTLADSVDEEQIVRLYRSILAAPA